MYSGTTRAARKFIGMMAAVAVVATSIVAVDTAISAQPAQAAEPLFCDGQGVYTLNANGGVREFMAENGSFTPTGNFNVTGQQANGLGVSGDGQFIYSIASYSHSWCEQADFYT